MNQILYKCTFDNNKNFKNNKIKFIIILVSAIFLIFIAVFIYSFIKYQMFQKEKLSKNLVSNFNIMTLYSDSNDSYNAMHAITETNKEPFVIGLIQIDKINLSYPILSTTNDELLKISPCRFYGPMPNEPRKFMYCWA